MISVRRIVIGVLVCLATSAGAQEWSELESLIFEPVPLRALETAAASIVEPPAARRDPSGEPEARSTIDRERLTAAVDVLLDAIEREEARNGENSLELVDELTELGGLYQELDDHLFAIVALERALQISRMNEGLYSLAQADIVDQLIASLAALRAFGEADSRYGYLLELVYRNPGDDRAPAALLRAAEYQMATADRLLTEGIPPQLTIGTGEPSNWYRPLPPSAERMALAALYGARRNYEGAIRALMASEDHNVADLMEIQQTIIDTYYYEAMHPELGTSGAGARAGRLHAFGARTLGAKVRNVANYDGSPIAVAEALVELADWHSLFSRNSSATKLYRAAHNLLVDEGTPAETITDIFLPDDPAALPAYATAPAAVDAKQRVSGHVDVAVKIGRYGQIKQVAILDRSANSTKAIERRLRRHIAQSRFRPRLEDDEFARSYDFPLRYYFSYEPNAALN